MTFGKKVGFIKQSAADEIAYSGIKGLGRADLAHINVVYVFDRSMMSKEPKIS